MISHNTLKELQEKAASAIPEIAVPADLLKELVEDLIFHKETYRKSPFGRDDPRQERKGQDRVSLLQMHRLKKLARDYMGPEFAQLEATVPVLERIFLLVHWGEMKSAKKLIGLLDGGYSKVKARKISEFYAAVEDGWFEMERDDLDEQVRTKLKCNLCDTTKTIDGTVEEDAYDSIEVFYSNHKSRRCPSDL